MLLGVAYCDAAGCFIGGYLLMDGTTQGGVAYLSPILKSRAHYWADLKYKKREVLKALDGRCIATLTRSSSDAMMKSFLFCREEKNKKKKKQNIQIMSYKK